MQDRIKKMYRVDSNLIIAFTMFLWIVLIYTMLIISGLALDNTLRIVAIGVVVLAGAAVTVLFAVLRHSKKNKQQFSGEDII